MYSEERTLSAQKLGKCFHLYESPSDRLRQFFWPRVQRALGRSVATYFREYWAIRNVSFEVRRGEAIGIIGRNGAGKSTLLQMLCGTLTPTTGTVQLSGRVAALLELGAGFNPEFTGRENIYLNGSVLGLSRAELEAKLGSILDFAELGSFIDQPVRTYSSGMYVRLAFSIAIHVDPDILIVDEALSVGDIAFQNKCLMKIREMRTQGTTLLFVTHDLSTLQLICDRAIWLRNGEIVMIGDPVAVCQEYYVHALGVSGTGLGHQTFISQKETGMARFVETRHAAAVNAATPTYRVGEQICLEFSLEAMHDLGKTAVAISVFRSDGDWVLGQTSLNAGVFWQPIKSGKLFHGRLILAPICLAPGDYLIALGANSEDLSICYALTELALPFSVRSDQPFWGKFIHPCEWIPLTKSIDKS